MSTLENISTIHRADLDRLNERIHTRLQTSNSMMSKIVLSLLSSKGKQLRPLMLIMCARMFGPADDRVIAAAAAVELIHNASLIHDDVVDNSMTRRGRPTVNAVWDNHIAVLVGDFFTSSAMQEAIFTDDIRIIDSLCSLGRSLSLGEIEQIYNAREHSLSVENYYRVIDYKTASLFVASARMGCFATGAPAEALDALTDFARLFGRCFQIRDDVFDYFPSDLVGKPTGNDLREGKVSLPILLALEKADEAQRKKVTEMLDRTSLSDEEIAYLQAFARDNGGIDMSFDVMYRLRDEAVAKLAGLPDADICRQLADLFDFIIARQF